MKKPIYIAFGSVFIVLGAIGVVLPFLPTSPFLLAATFCLARGSTRFHTWFTKTKLYQKYVGDYIQSHAMTVSTKAKILAMVSALILTGCLITQSLHARIAMGVVLIGHYYYFLIRLKTVPSGKPVSVQKRLLLMVKGALGLLAFNVFCRWIALLCNMAIIWSITNLLQKGFANRLSANLTVYISTFLLALIIRFFCIRMSFESSHKVATIAKKTLRDNIYVKLLRMGLSYRNSVSSAAVVQMSVEGIEKLQVYISGYLPQLFYSIIAPVTLFIVFVFIDLKIALVLLACVPLIPLLLLLIRKIAGRMMKKHWREYTDLGKSFLESLQGLTTLKIYNADEKRHMEINNAAEGFRKTTMQVLRMQLGSVTFMDLIAYGGTALGIGLAVLATMSGQIPLGVCVFIILLTSEFFLPLRSLGSFFHSSMNGIAAAEQIFTFLDAPESKKGTKEINGLDVVLSDCTYSYGEGRSALSALNMNIPFGSFIAVVGESGCGKSTLAKILAGELRDYVGSIKFGVTELSEATEKSIVRHVSLIEDSSYIFKGTLDKNLRFGCPKASKEAMLDALKKVGLYDFVIAKGGLNMPVSERGANLSGGQRQRLAVARALLHDADIYIFDEATSGIDSENETRLLETFKALVGYKTVILITHRMKLAEGAQSIIVLKDGKVVDHGTHSELYRRCTYYAELCDTQNNIECLAKSDKEVCYA